MRFDGVVVAAVTKVAVEFGQFAVLATHGLECTCRHGPHLLSYFFGY